MPDTTDDAKGEVAAPTTLLALPQAATAKSIKTPVAKGLILVPARRQPDVP
ncbi:MAG TPA: hypothetical protein VGG90_06290 [Candidatus Dormibacteraeota bacterium]